MSRPISLLSMSCPFVLVDVAVVVVVIVLIDVVAMAVAVVGVIRRFLDYDFCILLVQISHQWPLVTPRPLQLDALRMRELN